MKKFLIILGVIVAVCAVLGYVYRDALQFMMMTMTLKPEHGFAEVEPPPRPDYADEAYWAALPHREDNADVTPEGYDDGQANASFDAFFIHPTTYLSDASWNQPPGHEDAEQMLGDMVLRYQASVFNGCCRVFAPKYRQATLFSFMDESGSGERAIELAYQDVAMAFDYFIGRYNEGRPFIVAGHSQGARHAERLIAERIVDTPLMERLVAAYPVGFRISAERIGLPACQTERDVGCFVSWNAVGPNATNYGDPSDPPACVNPLSWRADGQRVAHEENRGAFAFEATDMEDAVADAQCVEGRLLVSDIRSDRFDARPLGTDNYHIYDYGLFYANIRANAITRTNTFLFSMKQPRVGSSPYRKTR